MTKQEYIEKINNFMEDCNDLSLLDLIMKLLVKCWIAQPDEGAQEDE